MKENELFPDFFLRFFDNFRQFFAFISMKYIFSFTLIVLLLVLSCTGGNVKAENILTGEDRSGVSVLSYGLEDNSTFLIRFSEKVEIREISYGGEREKTLLVGESFSLPLPREIEMGEKYTLALTAVKNGGNTTRCFFTLYGRNDNRAGMIINELSVAGTKASPDRVELLVTESGNTAGMVVADSTDSASGVILPSLEVSRGDIVVIYWDSKSGKETEERDEDLYTYYIDGKQENTLTSTSGAVILFEEVSGSVTDAVFYSNFTEASTSKEKFQSIVSFLGECGAWSGDAVSSEEITSSRVIARLPGAVDTDSADDWFTTAARKSTFGEENVYAPYTGE